MAMTLCMMIAAGSIECARAEAARAPKAGAVLKAGAVTKPKPQNRSTPVTPYTPDKIERTEAEWKRLLTPEQYRVLRQKGTEIAFTGAYWDNHRKGEYRCAACGYELFDSAHKFESGTGWPSFWAPTDEKHVRVNTDRTLGMERSEVVCARCGSHLGHVFDDGPKPTGLRYCMNSVSLTFVPSK
jgi:peptide-methionine (R)-S-oxide reductase